MSTPFSQIIAKNNYAEPLINIHSEARGQVRAGKFSEYSELSDNSENLNSNLNCQNILIIQNKKNSLNCQTIHNF